MPTPKTKRDLTRGGLTRNLWHLALPVMVSSALYDIFNIVDMIFVGRLGPEAIAAVSMSGILMGLIRMVVMGISAGTVALVSRFVGSRDHLSAESVLAQSIFLAVISSVIIAIAGHFLAAPVLRGLGASPEVVGPAAEYFRIVCYGSITMFLSIILGAGMRGFGDATTPMIALGIASLLNIGLDPLLIFGIGPFARLEVAGSALATVIARAIGSIILVVVLVRGKGGIRVSWPAKTAGVGRFSFIPRILKVGSFGALRMLSMNLSRIVLVRIVATFGTFAVAAFGIGLRLRIFVLILGFGLADATAVIVGQNLGAGHPERGERTAWLAVGYFALFLVFVSVAFLAVPRSIIGLFNDHPEVLDLGASFLIFFVPSLFFLDVSIVLGRALDGAGDTRTTMLITFLALIVLGVPMAWGFSQLWNVNGIWGALVGSNMAQGLGVFIWFRKGRWKTKKI